MSPPIRRVVAILETMWDWRSQTSSAGYAEAPRYFRINPRNYSGARLHKLVGPNAKLLVTNACRELVRSPSEHGKPDPGWLRENLRIMDTVEGVPAQGAIDVLLVCGKVAQRTYAQCGYVPKQARVIEMPHPAARGVWNQTFIHEMSQKIRAEGED